MPPDPPSAYSTPSYFSRTNSELLPPGLYYQNKLVLVVPKNRHVNCFLFITNKFAIVTDKRVYFLLVDKCF